MNAFDSLIETIRSELRGDESREELQRIIGAAGLPDTLFEEIVQRLQAAQPPLPPDFDFNAAANPSATNQDVVPRLVVDWGMLPQVGHQARPNFMVLCASSDYSQPEVHLNIDRDLDCPAHEDTISPVRIGSGQWEFHAAFGLTTNGQDCRPGQYLIRIRLRFRDASTGSMRFFQSVIRINIGNTGAAGPTLEIEGDGQSIVNLNGQDLRSFGRIVLRGSDSGIINIQSPDEVNSPRQNDRTSVGGLTYAYTLRIDHERQTDTPLVAAGFERQRLESGTLVLDGGRRITLMGKRRIQLGRSSDNDIVIRFLPRSEQNDGLSRNISRIHLVMSLQEDGLLLTDQSRTGTSVDFEPIAGDRLLQIEQCGDPLTVEMAISSDCLSPFPCQLQLYGSATEPDDRQRFERDWACCSAVGETVPGVWRHSLSSGIDSISLRGFRSGMEEEEFVCLYRQALIGSSQSRCAITLHQSGLPAVMARLLYIGRTYWLENLSEPELVRVNKRPLPLLRLVPLSASMCVMFASTACVFEKRL